ncbi:hypothetical protein ABHN11_12820 [Brevibacillus centrosporus]|uniref:hypothetical protein n=1 Tax=Brevibacillus centrosporus TaxID=54910 RepID=UPI003D19C268
MISIIFWGSTVLSLITALLAIILGKRRYMIVSAILYYPIAWYMNATPRYEGALLLYVLHVLIAYVLYIKKRELIWVAWLSLVPLILFPLWIALSVLNQ